jgi:hypothetical protein
MNGLKEALPPVTRVTYFEDSESLELTEEEKAIDDKRVEEELEILGSIGFKNAKEPYMKYPEAISKIDQMCKDLCQKLYVGENAHYLVGADKIPAYLSLFLEKMKRQAEEFKINQVRQLRVSAAKFQEMCSQVPYSVFSYLKTVYCNKIERDVKMTESEYDQKRTQAIELKETHLRMFRPNLENPSNKQATADLNKAEMKRSDDLKDVSKLVLYNSCVVN